jgi:hypothetical protein
MDCLPLPAPIALCAVYPTGLPLVQRSQRFAYTAFASVYILAHMILGGYNHLQINLAFSTRFIFETHPRHVALQVVALGNTEDAQ